MVTKEFKVEIELRINKISQLLEKNNIDAILLFDNSNLFYTSGRVFSGYTYITSDGKYFFFVKRPIGLAGENVIYIRKPEQISEELEKLGLELPKVLALELDNNSYLDIIRIENCFHGSNFVNGTPILREARSVKTDYEIAQIKDSGIRHTHSYSRINKLYKEGMTDIELQIEIERTLRLAGCLGQFRVAGPSMEIFMGNLLCGDNADSPSPYDFSMGGAGLNPSLPVGANGTIIRNGMAVMVDMCGNFNGYMTDMSRVFYVGSISDLAKKAHQVSIDMHKAIMEMAKPGTPAKELFELTQEMAKESGLEEYFMGYRQKAGFIGHGVGIEINEAPVIAPRSKDILQVGNVIALEPKFVIPLVGAVGIENTYVVTENGLQNLTNAPEELIELY